MNSYNALIAMRIVGTFQEIDRNLINSGVPPILSVS
jgi:hypothetical protein